MPRKQYSVPFLLLVLSCVFAIETFAHGTMAVPPSRIYNCVDEGAESPSSGGCQAAVGVGGTQPFYDWAAVNQLISGNHRVVVPDGQLCSGGNSLYAGLDAPEEDWFTTSIEADANGEYEFFYVAPGPHPTTYFEFYVTKDGYDPLKPLAWDDLEATPFCEYGDVPLEDGGYYMTCSLPEKTGRHVIYNIWQRDDSAEAFYSCSDVYFGALPTPTPTRPPVPGECFSADYSDVITYNEGDLAVHDNHEWEAQWWTNGTAPSAGGGPWRDLGECPAQATATPTRPPATSTPMPTSTPTPMPTTVAPSIDNPLTVQLNESGTGTQSTMWLLMVFGVAVALAIGVLQGTRRRR